MSGAVSKPAGQFTLHIEQIDGFEFRVRFDKDQFADLRMDEPPPLGRDSAPNPARVLAAAVGNCLAASLLFCAQRAGVALAGIGADVDAALVRNERGRLRIGKVGVTLRPRLPAGADAAALSGCLGAFEDFCVVTQSVREGIDVAVSVDLGVEGAPATPR
jgi:organic hydroperoxide reductase OsmC/OhrA